MVAAKSTDKLKPDSFQKNTSATVSNPTVSTAQSTFQHKLTQIKSIAELMVFFEISCESGFLKNHGVQLQKRFSGNVIIKKPDDWFSYRRCLKNAYCRIQRSLLPAGQRSACRGCTSCERR